MKIRLSRIAKLLQPLRFTHRTDSPMSGTAFVRVESSNPVTQWINVDWSGRERDAVYAYIGVGVSRHLLTSGLVYEEPLVEINEIRERGWTIIDTDEKAKEWEALLVRAAPSRVAALVAQHGPPLLRKTESARAAVQRYLARIGSIKSVKDRLGDLTRSASAEVIAEAERLASWPWVLSVPKAEDVYFLSCLSILLFSPEVENETTNFTGRDPRKDLELMWRIQLIADHLLYRGESRNALP